MVCRDKVTILNRVEVKDDFGGSKITFVPTKTIYANVRIFFSQNEDGLQNRQGLSHLEGTLYSRDAINTEYFKYEGNIYHIMVRNPQSKHYLYKFRGVKGNGRS